MNMYCIQSTICTASPPNIPSFLNHIPKSTVIAVVYLGLKLKAATFKSDDEP